MPNQAKAAPVNARDIRYALSSVPASERLAPSVHNHGTKTTKPSSQPGPPRAYKADSTALAMTPASYIGKAAELALRV